MPILLITLAFTATITAAETMGTETYRGWE